ncbi:unnamed protein product [Albugo candida]|uniref:Uncharacterized protein n=1 Tax=Albugo candida TaxID=65357 RepID=A0A024GP30_9STRA|nr:unnamed protein product [Albugo candida]|eukprot:CCI48108.1 unnamed protein product [Albugo candida]
MTTKFLGFLPVGFFLQIVKMSRNRVKMTRTCTRWALRRSSASRSRSSFDRKRIFCVSESIDFAVVKFRGNVFRLACDVRESRCFSSFPSVSMRFEARSSARRAMSAIRSASFGSKGCFTSKENDFVASKVECM